MENPPPSNPLQDSLEQSTFEGSIEQAKKMLKTVFGDLDSYTEKNAKLLASCIKDRKSIGIVGLKEILEYQSKKPDLSPSEFSLLMKSFIDLAKFVHGERINTESVSLNVNAGISEWEQKMATRAKETLKRL